MQHIIKSRLSELLYISKTNNLKYLKDAIYEFLDIKQESESNIVTDIVNQYKNEHRILEKYFGKYENFGHIICSYVLELGTSEDDSKELSQFRNNIINDSFFDMYNESTQKHFHKEFCMLLLTGFISVYYMNQQWPQNMFPEDISSSENIHTKAWAYDLNECFKFVYEDLHPNNCNVFSQFKIFISDELKSVFSSLILKTVVIQKKELQQTENETLSNLSTLKNQIDNFNLRLIEIIGIIIAIFSVIGFNVFTISNAKASFSPWELIEINLSIVLFIMILLGCATKLICDKKLPSSFYVFLIGLTAVFLLILFSNGTLIDVIINIFLK